MATKLELSAPKQVRFTQVDIKEPGENEIALEAVLSAVSHGTELSLYRGTSPFAHRSFDMEKRLFIDGGDSFPQAMGYEWVGRVVGVGGGVRIFQKGDLLHLPLLHAEWHLCSMDQFTAWGVRAPLPDTVGPE
ncbi:MAG: hypothetical protein RQ801_12345, partial [Spirochaetaceae bacterium]|nr:hypothetical protein [Spirochaetaceae bacterium]